jgi:hypothetical protein
MSAADPCRRTITWVLAEGHPLRRWLLAAQLAVANPQTSLYDSHGTWWVNILSLPHFVGAIKKALSARLDLAKHILGETYSTELRLAELRSSIPGVIIKINDGEIASVDEYILSSADLKTSGEWSTTVISFFIPAHSSFQHLREAAPTLVCHTVH